MIYGFLPFFMFGFLMTAVPNWLKVSVPRRYYLAAVLCMSAGWVLFYAGLATSSISPRRRSHSSWWDGALGSRVSCGWWC